MSSKIGRKGSCNHRTLTTTTTITNGSSHLLLLITMSPMMSSDAPMNPNPNLDYSYNADSKHNGWIPYHVDPTTRAAFPVMMLVYGGGCGDDGGGGGSTSGNEVAYPGVAVATYSFHQGSTRAMHCTSKASGWVEWPRPRGRPGRRGWHGSGAHIPSTTTATSNSSSSSIITITRLS